MINPYFNNLSYTPTQELHENLLIESIQQFGMDVVYLPRTLINIDEIWGEAEQEEFTNSFMIEMYLNNVEGFEGQGDLMSKFGVEIRDQATFWVARKRFQEEAQNNEIADLLYTQSNTSIELEEIQPREGDLIYLPLNGNFFEIAFVEREQMFYPQGKLMVFELRCELFEKSTETFNTGNTIIDNVSTVYPVSNTETTYPDDTNEFGIERDNIFDFSEDNPFSEQW